MQHDPNPELERVVLEVFGGCNYTCQMCPQTTGRGSDFTRAMPLKLFEDILDQVAEMGDPVINLEGSGEPTMAKNLDRYVQACTDRGLRSYMYTNGARLKDDYMKRVIDAGLSFVRFSVIGYDQPTYRQWMDSENFELVRANIRETNDFIYNGGYDCEVSSYHLILDNDNPEHDIEQYRTNVIDPCGTIGYIWKMHNWSGNIDPNYQRQGVKRTCGRPFANELTIRAGGLNGRRGAVTPCCQTLGPPNESASVLGHVDRDSVLDVWNGDAYNDLRAAHRDGEFDRISYCKDCDFLIEDPEVLVWSNDPDAKLHNMLGTKIDLQNY